MKLHEVLGRILTDAALRQRHANWGVCSCVDHIIQDARDAKAIDHMTMQAMYREWNVVSKACSQTGSSIFPVYHPTLTPAAGFREGVCQWSVWRGQYGLNRRCFLRACWRMAKGMDV